MLTAIPRYGVRVHPTTRQIVSACRERGEFIQGPQIAAFEQAFAARLGARHAVTASYGRMAFYFILKALGFPRGSEIIVPALTFWGVPEVARVAGMTVRFADVDPATFCMDPAAFERAITGRTRAVVPTHLYGLPCDMDAILDVAGRHNLAVVEDCAHALGATYRGRPVGTFGDGALFSFETMGLLNCCGGGMAVVREASVAARVRAQVEALPWPHERHVVNRLLVGRLRRIFTRPSVFTLTGFPILWASSYAGARPDIYRREKIRSLNPLPEDYLERCSNVQATLGLAGLDLLDSWTAATRAHAGALSMALADLPRVQVPAEPAERTHVYYRYSLCVPERDGLVRRCIRRGVDIETRHADVCTQLDLFAAERTEAPGASRAAQIVQVPVHAPLTDRQLRRVTKVVRRALTATAPGAPSSSSQAARA
jgi:dTDP-4-amino-4,6-dideoxygalactose transaminase